MSQSDVFLDRIVDVERRLRELEVARSPGWHSVPGGSGSVTASSGFTIDVPNTYDRLRLTLRGLTSADANVFLRINAVATTGLYIRSFIIRRASDGAVIFSGGAAAATLWIVGRWRNLNGCLVTVEIDTTTDAFPFMSESTAVDNATAANNWKGEFWGRLGTAGGAGFPVSELNVGSDGGSTITARYWLDGYR